MKKLFLMEVLCVSLVFNGMAQTDIIRQATQLEDKGLFNGAAELLTKAINSPAASATELKELEFERDRLERIKQDYSLTRDQLYQELKGAVKDLTAAEYDKWVQAGWFDSREIDGTLYFFGSGVSNLFFRHSELNPRRLKPRKNAERERLTLQNVEAIKQAAKAEHAPYVLPKKFHVTMGVTAKAEAAPAGEIIRAWVPIPRRYPFQSDFKLISSSCPVASIDDEESPVRSVYFEQVARKGKPTEFKIDYEFTMRGVHFDLAADQVRPYEPNDPAVRDYTGEGAHVVFTPEIKALSAKIIGHETNSLSKAKKIYDWLSDNLQYSYALEYSTIRNISDYCRSKGYGDCGQQALLFITLCRYNGVPARWQSGWNMFPGDTTNHDWTEIYLAPYGWMPVDPYMGNYAMRYITTLTPEQKLEIRDFYFGGLDQYRMAANSDHSHALNPPKQSMRSDDVDFQRGELEHSGKNIYFDQSSHHFERQELTFPQ
ncbi:MAG: Transglutaminase domain protein [Pedosphaera sp.]|nr:Transglutaminase domain protein [Pedosphaera sp.]